MPEDEVAPAPAAGEEPPQPMMPPRDEPGFPALPWAAGAISELFGVQPNPRALGH